MGGTLAAIEAGFQQRHIQEAAYQRLRAVEADDSVVVGVNRFVDDAWATPPLQRIDPDEELRQVERVRTARSSRDAGAADRALRGLAEAATGTDNLVPCLIEAARAGATLGEMSDTLRAQWGEHRERVTI
jgi:methylmalonyl-CoA mutase N-terminal domain/subunit